jgi:hypothetical protein
MSPGRPRSAPNLGPELEPRSRYSGRQQTDSGIAAVTAPRRGTPTQDFRGGAKPIALFSLQKTAKTASAQSHSHDSSGNGAPSLIPIPLHRRQPVPTAKVDPGPLFPARGRLRRESAEICALGASVGSAQRDRRGSPTRDRGRRPSVGRSGGRWPRAAAGWEDPEWGRPSATVRPWSGPRRARTSAPPRALRGRS